MPIISQSSYKPPVMFQNGHIQTIYPYLFRKVQTQEGKDIRIDTHDQDFLDLNLSTVNSKKVAILTHGMEGSTNAIYIKGMQKKLNDHGIDVVSWNMRSCGEEMNKQVRYYHGGATDDLETVVNYISDNYQYDEIILIGFSLGSNLTAKFLGEPGHKIPGNVCKSVLFSAPVDLMCCDRQLHNIYNYQYMETFLRTMRWKLREKNKNIKLDHLVDVDNVKKIRTLWEFTDQYVAPLHGFENAKTYYQQASSKQFLHNIEVPTLIVNAKNDPILGKDCYPLREARKNKNLFLEIPESGGHIGFISFKDYYWSEWRANQFIKKTA